MPDDKAHDSTRSEGARSAGDAGGGIRPPPPPAPESEPSGAAGTFAPGNTGYAVAQAMPVGSGGNKLALLALMVVVLLEQFGGLGWSVIVLGQMSGWDAEIAVDMIGDGVGFGVRQLVLAIGFFVVLMLGVVVFLWIALTPMGRRGAPATIVALYVLVSVLWWLTHTTMNVGGTFGWWR